MRTALRDADRMEREVLCMLLCSILNLGLQAMASDILEAACDHMVQLTHTSSPTSIIPEVFAYPRTARLLRALFCMVSLCLGFSTCCCAVRMGIGYSWPATALWTITRR